VVEGIAYVVGDVPGCVEPRPVFGVRRLESAA